MKLKNTLTFITFCFLGVISAIAQSINVDVNLNMKHSVGGVSDFGRDRHITVHAALTEPDWEGEAAKMDYLMNDLDVYFGRDNGRATWHFQQTPVDPNRENYPDIDEMAVRGAYWNEDYEKLSSNLLSYESRSTEMIMGTNPHPTYPTLSWYDNGYTQTDPKWQPLTIQTSADWVVEYLDKYFAKSQSEDGPQLPKYWEVINEPDMLYMTGQFMVTSQENIWEYHNLVAKGIKQRLGNKAPKIGGMTWGLHDLHLRDGISRYAPDNYDQWITDPAGQQFYREAAATAYYNNRNDDWYQWDVMWKGFIDAAGANMDFYAVHLYDWPEWESNGGVIRSGGHVEALLDMVEWYDVKKTGTRKPIVLSEYGAVTNYIEKQGLDPARRDWENLKPFSAMLMQFLERPDYIIKSMPFTPIKAEWGDWRDANGNVTNRYPYTLMDDNDGDGNWEWSEFIKWYELWADVEGTRIDTKSEDLDIQVDAYVKGDIVYLILNNLERNDKVVKLNFFGTNNNNLQNVRIKHLYLSGNKPTLSDNTQSSAPSSVTLGAEATMILAYNYSSNVQINQTSVERKYYGESLSGTVPNRVKVQDGTMTAHVNGVSVPSKGEAMLRLGGNFYWDHITKQDDRNKVTINGYELDFNNDWRGEKQGQRNTFFGVLEIPIPLKYLRANNTITSKFLNVCEYTQAIIQVWDMSVTPGRSDGGDDPIIDVTGVNLSPTSATVQVGSTTQLSAEVLPTDATNKMVSWSSNNTSIATVDGSGVVTGVAQGSANVTVTTTDGGFKKTATITVNPGDPILVTGVNVSPTSASISVGATSQLSAEVLPGNATNKSVTWSSNNTNVATVNSSGLVTAKAVGNATITVTTDDGNKKANCAIAVTTVNNGGTTITIEAETFTDHGGTYNDGHVPVGVNNGGNKINWVNSGDWAEYSINVTDPGTYSIRYMISSPENNAQIQIAFDGTTASTDNVVNNGQWDSYEALDAANNVTLSAGSHTVRITASGSNAWQWNLDKIILTKVGGGDTPVTGVSVNPTSLSFTSLNATSDLNETVSPSDATNKSVSWSSSNTSVATVNSSGLVTAKGNGNATITVTTADGGFKANASVTVSISSGQTPYPSGVAHAIPGTIESINFDNGGEGVAYHDATSGNSGNGPRQDQNVDTEYRIAAGNVGWITAGEWLEYTVNVSQAGTYKFEIKVASTGNNGAYHIEFNGVDKTGRQSVSATGGWGSFVTQTISGVSLNAGQQVMRVYMDGGSFNLGTMTISSDGNTNPVCDVPWTGDDYSVSKATNNWTSAAIDISCIDNAYISMTAAGVGPMENADYLNIYYSVDGGSRVAILQNTNTLSSRTVSADNVNGNSLQIIIEGKTSWADETYTVNNISVIDSKLKNSVGQMEDAVAMDALVYPNPVSNVLNIELISDIQDNSTIYVYNTVGTLVLTHDMQSNYENISVADLANGMYILRINNGTEVVTKRFTKN